VYFTINSLNYLKSLILLAWSRGQFPGHEVTTADAKGCLKGAVVGGTAGHFAGHHGILGAAAGCVIGRHQANKRARMQENQTPRGGESL